MARLTDTIQSTPAVTCMKIMLTVFNVIFWISGLAVLALGIWMKVDLHIYLELTSMYYGQTPLVLIGVGCGILVVGSLGCLCTVKGKSTWLYLFGAFLVIVFVVELSVAIAAFVYRNKLEDGFKEGLVDAMQNYQQDEDKSKAMDGMQSGLKCCGNATYSDWYKYDWSGQGASNSVPKSCCNTEKACKNTELPPTPQEPTDIYTQGCFKTVTEFLKKNFGIIGGVAIGFAFLQLFGAMLACCLAKNINKLAYEQVA